MCDLNKIGVLLATASAAVIVAIALFAIAAIAAGTFWGAFGNIVLMISAMVAIGVALTSINIAVASIGPCVQGSCQALAKTLQNALIALATALTVFLAALILGMFLTSIPWAGVAVAIGLGVGAVVIGIALKVASDNLLALNLCRGEAKTTEIVLGAGFALGAVILLAIFVVGVGLLWVRDF